MRQGVRSLPFLLRGLIPPQEPSPSPSATTEPRACTSFSWARLFGVVHCARELVLPCMTSLLVLFANHPHLTHLVSTCTTKFRSSRLSFSLRLEHCLLRLLPTGGTHGAPCGNHQDGARKEQNFFHVSSATRTQYASDSRLRLLGEGVFYRWLDPVLPHLIA